MKNKINYLSFYDDIKFIIGDIVKYYLWQGILIFFFSSIGILTTFVVIMQVVNFIASTLTHKPYQLLFLSINIDSYFIILLFAFGIFLCLVCGFIFEYMSKFMIANIACHYEKRCYINLIEIFSKPNTKIYYPFLYQAKYLHAILTRNIRYCNRCMYELLAAIGPIITILILSTYLAICYPTLFFVTSFITLIALWSQKKLGINAKNISKNVSRLGKRDTKSKKNYIDIVIYGKNKHLNLKTSEKKWNRFLRIYEKRLTITYKSIFMGNIFYAVGIFITVVIVCSDIVYHQAGSYFVIYYVLAAQYIFMQARTLGKITTKVKLFSAEAHHYFFFLSEAKKPQSKKIKESLSKEILKNIS